MLCGHKTLTVPCLFDNENRNCNHQRVCDQPRFINPQTWSACSLIPVTAVRSVASKKIRMIAIATWIGWTTPTKKTKRNFRAYFTMTTFFLLTALRVTFDRRAVPVKHKQVSTVYSHISRFTIPFVAGLVYSNPHLMWSPGSKMTARIQLILISVFLSRMSIPVTYV